VLQVLGCTKEQLEKNSVNFKRSIKKSQQEIGGYGEDFAIC